MFSLNQNILEHYDNYQQKGTIRHPAFNNLIDTDDTYLKHKNMLFNDSTQF
ncbi:hypothetical protein A1D15_1088 [Lactiplantibacillus plantarum]|nr:hypothetical protein A1D15_1088 [Lactiplantibacillus plantarum]